MSIHTFLPPVSSPSALVPLLSSSFLIPSHEFLFFSFFFLFCLLRFLVVVVSLFLFSVLLFVCFVSVISIPDPVNCFVDVMASSTAFNLFFYIMYQYSSKSFLYAFDRDLGKKSWHDFGSEKDCSVRWKLQSKWVPKWSCCRWIAIEVLIIHLLAALRWFGHHTISSTNDVCLLLWNILFLLKIDLC